MKTDGVGDQEWNFRILCPAFISEIIWRDGKRCRAVAPAVTGVLICCVLDKLVCLLGTSERGRKRDALMTTVIPLPSKAGGEGFLQLFV